METKATLGILAAFVVVVLGMAFIFTGGDLSMAGDGDDGVAAAGVYSYEGKNVEVALQSTNKYTAAAIDPTFYIYSEEPSNWGNGRVSVVDGYISSLASASGIATMTEEPGIYFVRVNITGYYDEFIEVEVPATGDVPLSQYNDGGEDIVKVKLTDIETLSVANIDLGILSTANVSSDVTKRVSTTFTVDEDEGYNLVEVKFQEDATYSFATDADGNGVYDEGINKLDFVFDGVTYTLFDATASIDEFGGDSLATVKFAEPKIYDENSFISVIFEVTCDGTANSTSDADELCGNGEDFIDSIIFVDASGATATFDLVG